MSANEIRRQSLGHVFPPRTPGSPAHRNLGYLMLVKSFTDDLAWEVRRKLVNSYFRAVQEAVSDLHAALPIPPSCEPCCGYTGKGHGAGSQGARAGTQRRSSMTAVAEAINCQSVQEIAKVLGTGPSACSGSCAKKGCLCVTTCPTSNTLTPDIFG